MNRCDHTGRRAGVERRCIRTPHSDALHTYTRLAEVSPGRVVVNEQRREVTGAMRAQQPWCARCGLTGLPLDAHELLSRARGGSITDRTNIVLLCRPCHDDVTFRHHLIPDADRWVLSAFGEAS